MKKAEVTLKSLSVNNNGKPNKENGDVLDRRCSYLLALTFFSPGANKNEKISSALKILDIENKINFDGTNLHTGKPYTMDEVTIFNCNIDRKAEITTTLLYVEYESIVFSVLKKVLREYVDSFTGLLSSLAENGIFKILNNKPIDILKKLPKMISDGRDSFSYEIGYGTVSFDVNDRPDREIELDVIKDVKRNLAYATNTGWYREKERIIVNKGNNGLLEVNIDIY